MTSPRRGEPHHRAASALFRPGGKSVDGWPPNKEVLRGRVRRDFEVVSRGRAWNVTGCPCLATRPPPLPLPAVIATVRGPGGRPGRCRARECCAPTQRRPSSSPIGDASCSVAGVVAGMIPAVPARA